jgi:hypothetical protein
MMGFVIPATPTDYAKVGSGIIRKHSQQLKQVPIRVAKIERCSGHPCKHYRFFGWLILKVEWNNMSLPKPRGGIKHVLESSTKSKVKAQPLRTGSDFPQAQHRVASPTDPKECNPPLPKHLREFQSQDLAIEFHGTFQVFDR